MSTSEVEILKLALNGGAFGLNLLIIVLLYSLVNRWTDKVVRALTAMTASHADLSARVDKLTKDAHRGKDSSR